MSEITASANLDWAWIEFVGLWLLAPLIFVLVSLSLIRHWHERRNR